MSYSIRIMEIFPEDCPLKKQNCLSCDYFVTATNEDNYIECAYEEKEKTK